MRIWPNRTRYLLRRLGGRRLLGRRGLARNERGGVLIEFAIVAPAVFAMLLGVLDVSLAYFTRVGMEHAVAETARVVRVGTMQEIVDNISTENAADTDATNDDQVDIMVDTFRAIFCENAPLLLNCTETGSDERVGVCIRTNNSLPLLIAEIENTSTGFVQLLPDDESSRICSDGSTGASSFVAVRVEYRHTYFTPFLGLLMRNDGGEGQSDLTFAYTFIFQNEPPA